MTQAAVRTEDVWFPSADGTSTMHGVVWRAAQPTAPRAVVQLVHGMAEHVMRYDEFARYLVGRGLTVCGHDHIGHGGSVEHAGQRGVMTTEDAAQVLVDDVDGLYRAAVDAGLVDARLPRFAFGHSMGSFVTRAYLTEHGDELAGAVICGTGNMSVLASRAGNALARAVGRVRGASYRSTLLDGLVTGSFAKRIEGARTPLDWLSHNPENIAAYQADEATGFMFSASAYQALTSLTARVARKGAFTGVPQGLPLFLIAGADDPVGDFGKGVLAVYHRYQAAGVRDVDLKLYSNMRHEILNENDRGQVMLDVATWMEEHL